MKTYKIYYINLDRSQKRNDFIKKQLDDLNQEYTRISAVNGGDLDEEIVNQANKSQSLVMSLVKPSAGQVGCFLSHRKAWGIIKEQKEDFAILLEDDNIIHKELFCDLSDILNSISTYDYVALSGSKGKMIFETNKLLTKFIIPAHGTIGQIVGKDSAKTLYENMTEYKTAVDNMLRFVYIYKAPIWTSNKAYLTIIDEELGGSTIGYSPQNKNIFLKITKPFWKISHIIMKLNLRLQNYLFYYYNKGSIKNAKK